MRFCARHRVIRGSLCIIARNGEAKKMQIPVNANHSLRAALMLAALLLISSPLLAQWTKIPAAAIPRTADGKPDLFAPAPRLPGGKPDLSGIWEPNANKYLRNIAADLKPEDVPFQPWAKA